MMSIGISNDESVAKLIVRETRLHDMYMKTDNAKITQEYETSKKCHN